MVGEHAGPAANGQQQPRRAMTVRTIDLAEWIRSMCSTAKALEVLEVAARS